LKEPEKVTTVTVWERDGDKTRVVRELEAYRRPGENVKRVGGVVVSVTWSGLFGHPDWLLHGWQFLSPDGKRLALPATSDPSARDIKVLEVTGLAEWVRQTVLEPHERDREHQGKRLREDIASVRWSADSRSLLVVAHFPQYLHVLTLDADNGTRRLLCEGPVPLWGSSGSIDLRQKFPCPAWWSPDGKRIYLQAGHQLFVWDAATGKRLPGRLYDAKRYLPEGPPKTPLPLAWSPDGELVAAFRHRRWHIWRVAPTRDAP
jgi:hypothetical protein